MAWVVDNASDEAVIECQKEIRRLRGVVRELQNKAEENKLVKRAVWKDYEIIGYLSLTDEQVEALNSLKDTGIYVGSDQNTEPKEYKNGFSYNGYHFAPVRSLTNKENDFKYISARIYTERTLGMATYDFDWVKNPWNYADFYKASPVKEADLFRCMETDLIYIPGENELFGWKGEKEQ